MNAFLIDPAARTIREIEIGHTHEGVLKELQKFVGGYIEPGGTLDNGDMIFVNEEGLIRGFTSFFEVQGFGQPLAGCGVVVGTGRNGDSVSAKSTMAELREIISFTNRFELQIRYAQEAKNEKG